MIGAQAEAHRPRRCTSRRGRDPGRGQSDCPRRAGVGRRRPSWRGQPDGGPCCMPRRYATCLASVGATNWVILHVFSNALGTSSWLAVDSLLPRRPAALNESRCALSSRTPTSRCRSATLVVEYELSNRLQELVALPQALDSKNVLGLSFRRGSTCGLDCVGGRTELVRGDVCDGRGLAGGVRGKAGCPTQVSGRGV
jgi:hypothetical protein